MLSRAGRSPWLRDSCSTAVAVAVATAGIFHRSHGEHGEASDSGDIVWPGPELLWGKRGEIISPTCPKRFDRGASYPVLQVVLGASVTRWRRFAVPSRRHAFLRRPLLLRIAERVRQRVSLEPDRQADFADLREGDPLRGGRRAAG